MTRQSRKERRWPIGQIAGDIGEIAKVGESFITGANACKSLSGILQTISGMQLLLS